MTPAELVKAADAVLVRIHVITGWAVPQKELQDILIDELIKKFNESYSNVNPDEVMYAFRNNTSVKDWGKAMNLALIDEVMIPYLEARLELSHTEENLSKPKEISYQPIEMPDEELVKATLETYKLLKNLFVIPESVFFYLEKTGRIILTNEQKNEIKSRVTGDDPVTVKATCRKLAVANYFDELIKTGQ